MTDLSAPRDTTIRKLFAVSKNRCAFPDCVTPVLDPKTNTILAEVCHICAQNDQGPRFDASQTPEERHSFENLILLCSVHHKLIDARENLSTYTAQYLYAMKAKHEGAARESGAPLPKLTEEQVRVLRETSVTYAPSSVHMDFREAVFKVGGEGGGFGGGGGSGGVLTIVGTSRPPPDASVEADGKDGTAPGGGGGGAGAVRFVGRPVSPEDVANGFRFSSMFTANAVVVSGLFHVLGGGWSYLPLRELPSAVGIHLVLVIDTGTILADTLLRFDLNVLNNRGDLALLDSFDVTVYKSADLTPRQTVARFLKFDVNEAGVWSMEAWSGDLCFAEYELEFRLVPPG